MKKPKEKRKSYINGTLSLATEEHIVIMEVLILACHNMKQRYNKDQGSKWHISLWLVNYSASINP